MTSLTHEPCPPCPTADLPAHGGTENDALNGDARDFSLPQQRNASSPSARSSSEEATSASAQSPEDLSAFASAFAELIHRREAATHRGVMPLSSIGLIAIYNSHPYAASTHVRSNEQAEIERALNTACISVLASASFPPDGADCGYTRVMLVCGDGETAGECSRICVAAWENSKMQLAEFKKTDRRAKRKGE